MKKMYFCLFLAFFCICNIASAEIICVKKKVTTGKAISLARNIKIVNGDTCPKGFNKLVDTQTFVGPQGEKGDKGDQGEAGQDGANFYDTKYLPVGETLTGVVGGKKEEYVSFVVPPENPIYIGQTWECWGTFEEPTAPAGKICIYPIIGKPQAELIPSGTPIELNTKTSCEDLLFIWEKPYCIANKRDGVTPIDKAEDCSHGPYAVGNTWNGVTKTCTRSKYDKKDCETSLYTWDDTEGCFVDDVLGREADEAECEAVQGVWRTKGCSEPSFTDKKSCLAPSLGTWVPGVCSQNKASEEFDFSNKGFRAYYPGGDFVASWAVTAGQTQ